MPNKINQPFIILALAVFFVASSYFFVGEVNYYGFKIKAVNLVGDLNAPPKKLRINTPLILQKDTSKSVIASDTCIVYNTGNGGCITEQILIANNDTAGLLNHFFNSLQKVKQGGKVRIAYFGDSMIEGDLLTQDLRYFFQRDFGGRGVGFVPVTSPVAGFRKTIVNNASKNWEVYNLVNSDTSYLHRPGISGYSFLPGLSAITLDSLVPEKTSWVKFTASKSYPTLKDFYNVSLYYGKALTANARISYTFGGKYETIPLNGNQTVNEVVLNKMNPQQYLTLNMVCSRPTPIYGLNFDSDSGVFIDNFAFRGNSGLALTKIPYRVLKDFNQYLKYDLIVLQYGLNVAHASVKDYSWYEAGMIRVINYLKSCFPQASFLLVSVGDKSRNNDGVYETDPSIPLLVESQKRIAQKTGTAFWNLYEAMGGYNSMVAWAEGDTVYANKDYTHLNHKGAARVAKSLYQHLMQEYAFYKSKQPQNSYDKQALNKIQLTSGLDKRL